MTQTGEYGKNRQQPAVPQPTVPYPDDLDSFFLDLDEPDWYDTPPVPPPSIPVIHEIAIRSNMTDDNLATAGMSDATEETEEANPSRMLIVFAILILLSGLALLAYPVAVSWYEAWLAERSISTISDVYNNLDNETRKENVAQAHAYNAVLAGQVPDIPVEDIWAYDQQLTYHDQPATMMSFIDIPKISSRLPVYHHATDEVLMAGVGHIDMTALPIGGVGTKCVLSGHSGMQYARMFDDIRLLENGDTFVLWTLSEPYAYRVCDIRVVLPEEATKFIEPEEGRDLCTLITCTPFGVNTHRLIVTGERCEYVPEEQPTTRAYVNNRTVPFLIGLGIVLLIAIFLIVVSIRRRKRRKEEMSQTMSACHGIS